MKKLTRSRGYSKMIYEFNLLYQKLLYASLVNSEERGEIPHCQEVIAK